MSDGINVVFTGPPGHISGEFVEVETDDGKSVGVGEWLERADGMWSLRFAAADFDKLRILEARAQVDPLNTGRDCQLCQHYSPELRPRVAKYDARTTKGPRPGSWADVCEGHFQTHTEGVVGTGRATLLPDLGEPTG